MERAALLVSFLLLSANLEAADLWEITPCASFGPVRPGMSHADLIRLFGRGNVQDAEIEGAEGERFAAAIVFPSEPMKTFRVIWKDQVKTSPAEVSVSGTKSVWKTPQGVTLGTSLKDLEKWNGRSVTISGFGWDYGGHVLEWNGGTLASIYPKSFGVRLDPSPSKAATPAVSGDKPLSSANPALKALDPQVVEISCQFP